MYMRFHMKRKHKYGGNISQATSSNAKKNQRNLAKKKIKMISCLSRGCDFTTSDECSLCKIKLKPMSLKIHMKTKHEKKNQVKISTETTNLTNDDNVEMEEVQESESESETEINDMNIQQPGIGSDLIAEVAESSKAQLRMKCPVCEKSFTRKYNIKPHLWSVHHIGPKIQKKLSCKH